MMSESKTNRPTNEEERNQLLQELLKERYGDPTRERYQITKTSK